MANLYDYLDWRGDLTFAQSPLNEVDSLIFSWLAYVEWNGVLPGSGEGEALPLIQAAEIYFSLHSVPAEKNAAYSINPKITGAVLLQRLMGCERFRHVKLCAFANELDEGAQKQFAALTIMGEDWAYVSYRGTDTSLIGWKEDCFLVFDEAVPAQLAALEYLGRVPELEKRALYLGGHSKGGNLAVYAGVKCAPEMAMRIEKIYNHDGPGFPLSFIQGMDYMRMLPRIHTIIPQSSVVGLLLEHREAHAIVKSAQVSVLQHNAVHWEVKGTAFVREKDVSSVSLLFDRTLRDWLARLSETEQRSFIETLFGLLEATGAKYIEELGEDGLGNLIRALRALSGLEWEKKGMMLRAVLLLVQAGNSNLYQALGVPGQELLQMGQRHARTIREWIQEMLDKILGMDEEGEQHIPEDE